LKKKNFIYNNNNKLMINYTRHLVYYELLNDYKYELK